MSSSKSLCEAIRTTVDSSFLFESPCFILFQLATSLAQKDLGATSNSPDKNHHHPGPTTKLKHSQDTRWQQSMPWLFRVDPRSPNHITIKKTPLSPASPPESSSFPKIDLFP